jgi:hypothetical protein
MSVWYVIIDPTGKYLPLDGGRWVENVSEAEVYTSLGNAKGALRRYPSCRLQRLPRLPDRVPRK